MNDSRTFLINLVSEQAAPSLIPALATGLGVTDVVLLASQAMTRQARRLDRVFQIRKIPCRVWPGAVPAYDAKGMEGLCREVLASIPAESRVILNATGGTKLMSLAALTAFRDAGREVVYVDTQNGLLHFLHDPGLKPENLDPCLSIGDYLVTHGFIIRGRRGSWRSGKALPTRKNSTKLLARHCPGLSRFLSLFNSLGVQSLARHCKDSPWPRSVKLTRQIRRAGRQRELIESFEEEGLVAVRQDRVEFAGPEEAFYLSGGWLEEHAFVSACESGAQEAAMSVEVDWDTREDYGVSNEFDCLAIWNNRMFVIECKTANLAGGKAGGQKAGQMLYKLESLRSKVAGVFGKGAVVTAKRPEPTALSRARANGLEVFGPEEVSDLASAIGAWMRNA